MIGRINTGGSAIDIEAKASTIIPATGKENDVVIISSVQVNKVYIGNKPSTPKNGDVYFSIGSTVDAKIAVGKTIVLYPRECQQYQNGTWVSVNWVTYHSGWKRGIIYLIQNASYCADITGGWTGWAIGYDTTNTITDANRRVISLGSSYVRMSMRSGYGDVIRGYAFKTSNKINFKYYDKLQVKYSATGLADTWYLLVGTGSETKGNACVKKLKLDNGTYSNKTVEIDVANLTSPYCVAVVHQGGATESSMQNMDISYMRLITNN